ncbi:MAG: hypothetical protein WEA99_13365 [Brumimicrobium sp.]
MYKFSIGVMLLLFSNITQSQSSYPRIYFEVGYNYQQTKMQQYNNHLNLIETDVFKLDEHLESVNSLSLALKYKPKSIFDLGLYLEKQSQTLDRYPMQKKLNPDLTVTYVEGYHKNQINSCNIGVSATIYVNQLLKLKYHNEFFKRLDFGLELKGGVGFSKYFSETHYATFSPIGIGSATRKANGFQGQLGFNFEYSYIKTPIISSIGIRIGYQFYNTSILENQLGYKWGDQKYEWSSAEEPINLDFSGIYYGIYLKIGK